MKPEYHEGPEALERFEKTMTTLFRAPKDSDNEKGHEEEESAQTQGYQQGLAFVLATPLP